MAELQEVVSREESSETREFLDFFQSKKKQDFKNSSQSKAQKAKLARVPEESRYIEGIKECFEPKVVSIGPYHHGNPKLQATEEFKKNMAKKFVHTSGRPADELYYKLFNEIEQIRDLYEEDPTYKYNNEALTRILFVDGCFVLYFIYCILSSKTDELNVKSHHFNGVMMDMFLLENQLPFRVLELLLGENFQEYKRYSMIEKYIEFISQFVMPMFHVMPMFVRKKKFSLDPKNSIHLIQILQMKILGSSKKDKEIERQYNFATTYSVTELRAAGIRCKPSSKSGTRQVHFSSHWFAGVLELPSLLITHATKLLAFNMIAYENHPDVTCTEVQSYITLLASLLRQPEDVKELRENRILFCCIGSDEEVVKLFKELADKSSIDFTDTYFNIRLQIGLYLKKRGIIMMASWLAEVSCKYFKSPWTVIALLGGFLALSATIIQTYLTLLSYKHVH